MLFIDLYECFIDIKVLIKIIFYIIILYFIYFEFYKLDKNNFSIEYVLY